MYAYIKGIVTAVYTQNIVVEVAGVGYELITPNAYSFQQYIEQSPMTIYTQQIVREDAHSLYGFIQLEQKQLFNQLLKVKGIGPKSALAILAACQVNEIVSAIEQENIKFLTKFPGIGAKSAKQMVLDLKGKLSEFQGGEVQLIETKKTVATPSEIVEALLVLEALGYSKREVDKIEKKMLLQSLDSVDDYVKLGLKLLTRL